jgi:hypothetical protein
VRAGCEHAAGPHQPNPQTLNREEGP